MGTYIKLFNQESSREGKRDKINFKQTQIGGGGKRFVGQQSLKILTPYQITTIVYINILICHN